MSRIIRLIPTGFFITTFIALDLNAVEPISFNERIRPILADRCFKCHGPDSTTRQAGLRLDREEIAKNALEDSGNIPIVAGNPEQSEVFARLISTDPAEQMPPPDSKLSVSPLEIQSIKRWIESGARWERHWSFITPMKSPLPTVAGRSWPSNEIDHFILARLEAAGLQPTSMANKEHLLRRVTFALTGLPPTLDDLDTFIADSDDGAYEKAVDRLLASPALGERMALEWLDMARYGDTDGLFEDHPRSIFPWRDWVVDAFNQNLSYNDFITWQLAGDLLPQATVPQRVATGFLRNNPTSNEGGLIDEDYRVKYLVDRVNTTATVFLGLTLECAQCHDHKYDPMTQREYYQFAGFFNSLQGNGNTKGATEPTLRLYSSEQRTQIAKLDQQLAEVDAKLASTPAELTADFTKWLEQLKRPITWQLPKLATNSDFQIVDGWFQVQTIEASDDPQTATLLILPKPGQLSALQISTQSPNQIHIVDGKLLSDSGQKEPTALKFDGKTEWTLQDEPVVIGLKSDVTVRDGQQLALTVKSSNLAKFRLTTSDDTTAAIRNKLPQEPDKRLDYYRRQWSGFDDTRKHKETLSKAKIDLESEVPLTMIATDLTEPRPNYVLTRGEYDRRDEVVTTAPPTSIMAGKETMPNNRVHLAHWLTDPNHPLTARVAVNRYWQMIFGVGIVKTSEDFGTQGSQPSHKQLLDYLAVDFIESGWDVKALIRKMVLSATYRQASVVNAHVLNLDPENRLLSRASRLRLPAEFIRDHALSVSGLLVNRQGGPGVNPYQPAFLFGRDAIGAFGYKLNLGTGANLYRRSLYTYWKRQIPVSNMRILGADGRLTCRTRRERTNTPLQALVLLNDRQFIEAARVLAERSIRQGGRTLKHRLSFAFRLATSRNPSTVELNILRQEYTDRLQRFQSKTDAATAYLTGGGNRQPPEDLDQAELAAFAAVVSLILNLDESISAS